MIDMKIEKKPDNGFVLHLSGNLTITNVRPFYEKVCELMDMPGELTVHIGNTDAVDCTFMQVLCTAHRAYLTRDKNFSVKTDSGEIFKKSGWCGITPGKACAHDIFGTCFLTEEEK